jgi:hypothetical protein
MREFPPQNNAMQMTSNNILLHVVVVFLRNEKKSGMIEPLVGKTMGINVILWTAAYLPIYGFGLLLLFINGSAVRAISPKPIACGRLRTGTEIRSICDLSHRSTIPREVQILS